MVSSGSRSMAETRPRRTGRQDFPKRGEIYLTALDPALGHEIKKTRPALVIQNDVARVYLLVVVVVVPFSSIVLLATMLVDCDTPVSGAANQLTHGRAARAGRKVLVAERNRSGRR